MNGGERGYLEKLLTEKFTNLHHRLDEVKADTEKMSGKLDTLPCDVHAERIKFNKVLLIIVITSIIGVAVKVWAR